MGLEDLAMTAAGLAVTVLIIALTKPPPEQQDEPE